MSAKPMAFGVGCLNPSANSYFVRTSLRSLVLTMANNNTQGSTTPQP
jgi:hypothetical protein